MNVCNIHSNELICDVTSRLGLPLQRYSHPIIRKYICNYIGFSITTSQHALNRVIDQVIQHGTVLLLNSITNIIHMQNHKKWVTYWVGSCGHIGEKYLTCDITFQVFQVFEETRKKIFVTQKTNFIAIKVEFSRW